MNVQIRKYMHSDLPQMRQIWNEVVLEGVSFPQDEPLTSSQAEDFFASHSYCSVAQDKETEKVLGLYILHPNNIGRCAHISNASYAVSSEFRGQGIGRLLVADCIAQAKNCGFKILQFNAVVRTNVSARRLYESLGFIQLGTIPQGFLMKNGNYEDICPYYKLL